MFGPRELDIRNIYNPNLKDIKESAERTYGEANVFFEMLENYLKNIEPIIDKFSEKDIYDISNAIASELAKCCELYLKALYIYENNINGNNIDDIWRDLKTSSYKTDKYGNPIYLLEKDDKTKIYTYVKVDEKGIKVLDEKGKNIYVDENKNVYSDGSQGKKIKLNGHQLDRLIEKLSVDSRLLLEMRMLIIPMANTEMYDEVSIYDALKKTGVIFGSKLMTQDEYMGWIDQHKKTFEETRYAGQKKYNINLEFLYHLAKQIKAVVQYKIKPNKNQLFNMNKKEFDYMDINSVGKLIRMLETDILKAVKLESDDNICNDFIINEEDFSKMPNEIQELDNLNYKLISLELINLVKNDKKAKEKLYYIITLSNKCVLKEINSNAIYRLLSFCDTDEIYYLVSICNFLTDDNWYNYKGEKKYNLEIENIGLAFKTLNFAVGDVINYSIYLKKKFNCKIDVNIFMTFIDFMNFIDYFYDQINDGIKIDSKKRNYF